MKRDRFLIGIVVAIVMLIVVTVVLFFIRQGRQTYVSDNTPEGVVHNYTLALINHDYHKAYAYLADLEYKPTFAEFLKSMANLPPDHLALEIGEAQTYPVDTMKVSVYIVDNSFGSDYQAWTDTSNLVLQDGKWKLSSMPPQLWDYSWYREPQNPQY